VEKVLLLSYHKHKKVERKTKYRLSFVEKKTTATATATTAQSISNQPIWFLVKGSLEERQRTNVNIRYSSLKRLGKRKIF